MILEREEGGRKEKETSIERKREKHPWGCFPYCPDREWSPFGIRTQLCTEYLEEWVIRGREVKEGGENDLENRGEEAAISEVSLKDFFF